MTPQAKSSQGVISIPDLIAKLSALDATLDPRNEPTPRGQEETAVRKRAIAAARSVLMNAPSDVARQVAYLVDLEARRQAVVAKQAEIEQQIADAPDWQVIRDGRTRDAEEDRQWQLKRQLERLHEGSLPASPGVTYERVADLDIQIAERTQRRDGAQAQLDACVAQAEQLLAARQTAATV